MKSRTGNKASSGLVVVVTTVGKEVDAQRIARAAVEARLAACVQSLPIHSVYRWKGIVENSPEIQLLFKVPRRAKSGLVKWLSTNHPYETPEILVLPVLDVSPSYLAWAHDATRKDASL